jgi:uncharacterized protein
MKKMVTLTIGLCALDMTAPAQSMPLWMQEEAGFAANCAATSASLSPVEAIVCRDPALRKKDAHMVALVRRVSSEVAGIDGESGDPINPIAREQTAWRKVILARCKDAACLLAAYDARIAEIRARWREALQ